MSADLNKYLKLQKSLINEKSSIEARLAQITKVLGQGVSATPAPAAKPGGRRQFSEATKAKMRAAQQARWARLKGAAVVATPPTSPSSAPKKKRKLSAAGKAAIIAATKARWAKIKADKAAADTKR